MKNCPSCLKVTRRGLLTGAGAWAAMAALVERGEAQVSALPVTPRGTAKNCVFINLSGAPSHLDTFDPKDGPWNAPDADIREHAGGILLNNTFFPRLSEIAGDLAVLRSVVSWEAAHDRGQFYMQTSHPANPAFVGETPHIGAVVALEMGKQSRLPPFLALNGSTRGATFLGGKYEPMSAPANAGGFTTLQHNFFGANSQARFDDRYKLLQKLDAEIRTAPHDRAMGNHATYYEAARQLMYDPVITDVFRFAADEDARYGTSPFGRSLLVARNAIRANQGAVFFNVTNGGWDLHQRQFDTGYRGNLYELTGILDRAVGALVEDLKSSGHFDSTLIVMMGEFGRTPGNLNVSGGRDHHRNAMCAVMLGGGVRGGRAIGATDENGAEVSDPGWRKGRPIYFEDITATIYSALGINWSKSITDTPSGRRFEYVPYASSGQYTAIEEVFG